MATDWLSKRDGLDHRRGKPTDRPINWKYWGSLQDWAQWDAFALSLNINPDNLEKSRHSWMAGPGSGPIFEKGSFPSPAAEIEFRRRLTMFGRVIGGRPLATVNPAQFAAWCLQVGLENLPPELVAMAAIEPQDAAVRQVPPVVAESHGLNVVTGGASGDAVTEKKTYPRGSGCRGATARPKPEPPAHPMADWELWAHMPKATVREAVLLSLGLEPRPPVLTWTQYEAPRSYAEPGREFERRLMLAAAHVDASGPLHPLGSMPSPEDATVSLPEFGAWARGLGWVLPEQFLAMSAAQAQQAPEPQAAPVVAESATGGEGEQAPPDPERRLALLRAGGGSVKFRHGEWKFTGIAALVASEKAEGRKRSDEKTIRADLREAAQAESEAKRAGPWQGLGG